MDLPESEEKALNVTLNNPAITGEFTDGLQAILGELAANPEIEFEELQLDALLVSVGRRLAAPRLPPVALQRSGVPTNKTLANSNRAKT